jgi:D-arabinose 1-dehydrogenase-like Zn-dependent alcohol dehydrogenase
MKIGSTYTGTNNSDVDDLHLWQGDSEYEEPFIIGHEGLGRVIALGEGVKTTMVGLHSLS